MGVRQSRTNASGASGRRVSVATTARSSPTGTGRSESETVGHLLELQRTAGNEAVTRLISGAATMPWSGSAGLPIQRSKDDVASLVLELNAPPPLHPIVKPGEPPVPDFKSAQHRYQVHVSDVVKRMKALVDGNPDAETCSELARKANELIEHFNGDPLLGTFKTRILQTLEKVAERASEAGRTSPVGEVDNGPAAGPSGGPAAAASSAASVRSGAPSGPAPAAAAAAANVLIPTMSVTQVQAAFNRAGNTNPMTATGLQWWWFADNTDKRDGKFADGARWTKTTRTGGSRWGGRYTTAYALPGGTWEIHIHRDDTGRAISCNVQSKGAVGDTTVSRNYPLDMDKIAQIGIPRKQGPEPPWDAWKVPQPV